MDSWPLFRSKTDEELKKIYLGEVKASFDDTSQGFADKWMNLSTVLKQSNQTGILFDMKTYFSLIILVLFKYFWDAIDLTMDVYIFYRLEHGEILDDVIYRSFHVNNAIYTFAIVGCVAKIAAWKLYTSNIVVWTDSDDEPFSYVLKHSIVLASFLSEDGPELILEYFYIEKYITSYTPMIIVNDAMITCLLLYTTIGIIKFCITEIKDLWP